LYSIESCLFFVDSFFLFENNDGCVGELTRTHIKLNVVSVTRGKLLTSSLSPLSIEFAFIATLNLTWLRGEELGK
jgi:hypothetical protein